MLALEYFNSPRYAYARLLLRRGEVDRARPLLEALETEAAAQGDEGTCVMALWPLSMLEWLSGHWSLALDRAAAAVTTWARRSSTITVAGGSGAPRR